MLENLIGARLPQICTILVLFFCSTGALASGVDLALERAPSGNLYVQAGLGGAVSTDMLLDTGSGYVTLSGATFRKLKRQTDGVGAPEFRRHINGTMANGRTASVPVYRIRELSFGDCTLENVEIVVFAKADRDILGLNALRRIQPFTVDLDDGRLTSNGCR